MTRAAGFGLVETLLALSLGLLVLLAGSRLFVSGVQTWQAQVVSARLQEDARLVLVRLARDIRGAGMLGCLELRPDDFEDTDIAQAFARPVDIERTPDGRVSRVTVITAAAGEQGGAPDWTIITDCTGYAKVLKGHRPAGSGQFGLPVRKQVYRFEGDEIRLSNVNGTGGLVEQVRGFTLEERRGAHGHALHLQLVLGDQQGRVRDQVYPQTVALRNRWP